MFYLPMSSRGDSPPRYATSCQPNIHHTLDACVPLIVRIHASICSRAPLLASSGPPHHSQQPPPRDDDPNQHRQCQLYEDFFLLFLFSLCISSSFTNLLSKICRGVLSLHEGGLSLYANGGARGQYQRLRCAVA